MNKLAISAINELIGCVTHIWIKSLQVFRPFALIFIYLKFIVSFIGLYRHIFQCKTKGSNTLGLLSFVLTADGRKVQWIADPYLAHSSATNGNDILDLHSAHIVGYSLRASLPDSLF